MSERPVRELFLVHKSLAEGETQMGDLTNDGNINILDVVTLVNYILAGQSPYNDHYNTYGNLNGDGNINVLDVVSLVNFILAGD